MNILKNLLIVMVLLWIGNPPAMAKDRTYKHISEFRVATFDEVGDQTLLKALGLMSRNAAPRIYLLHNEDGSFLLETPVRMGMTFLAAPFGGSTQYKEWIMDYIALGEDVLLAAKCARPNKRRPYQAVTCEFWLPDTHNPPKEYNTKGWFTPRMDGNFTDEVANRECGTGRMDPRTEAAICPKK